MKNRLAHFGHKIIHFARHFWKELWLALILAIVAGVGYDVIKEKIEENTLHNATQAIALVATLMKVESGTVNKPSVQTMAKIAKVLDVSIDELIKV